MKRDIFKFMSDATPTAINLEHVITMSLNGKRITFGFIANGLNVDMESEDQAKAAFETLLKIWVEGAESIQISQPVEPVDVVA